MSRSHTRRLLSAPILAILGAGLALPAAPAAAQYDQSQRKVVVNPKRETLVRLSQPMTINLEQQRLEDVIQFAADFSGANIEPLWIDDNNSSGHDPDLEITVKIQQGTVLDLLERVLSRSADDAGFPESFTWQLTPNGAFEMGPKDRLNRRKTTVIYDIRDLIFEIPDYDEAPEFDLQSVLQAGQGGGGQSPFSGQTQDRERADKRELGEEVITMITTLVEPDEWATNGGDGASVTYYQENLIVRAPDYIHRQLNGYSFWPRNLTRATYANGQRRVDVLPDPGARRKAP
ncbi:MAG: hypothetical protein ACIARR_04015 [Phycisphaerales bacterium JB059]